MLQPLSSILDPRRPAVGLRHRGNGVALLLGCVGAALLCAGCQRESLGPGFVRRVFIDDYGNENRYLVFLPRDFSPGDRRPVIAFLNGFGENGVDGLQQISNNFGWDVWRMRDVFPFVMVAPQCRPGENWIGPRGQAHVALAILDDVQTTYGTDPDRVYLTGVSSGGSAVWSMASEHPERFAAIAPFCGAGGHAKGLADANVPVWSFCNDGDEPGIVGSNCGLREQLIRQGRSPLLTLYHQDGHDCWNRGYANEALYTWLLNHDRRANQREERRFTYAEAEAIVEGWGGTAGPNWRAEGEALVCAGSNHAAPEALVNPAELGDFELHGDARWNRESACRIGLFDAGADSEAIVALSLPFADSGLGGVLTPEGRIVESLDPIGQRQLDTQGWNDLRLTKRGDSLSVTINGWPALECSDSRFRQICRFGLLSPDVPGAEVRWRFVRWRGLTVTERTATQAVGTQPAVTQPARAGISRSPPSDRAGTAAADCDSVIAGWRKRESVLAVAEAEWQVRGNQFALFGGYPRAPGGKSERLMVDGPRWRFDGYRVPEVALGLPHARPADADAQSQFRALLLLLESGRAPTFAAPTAAECTAWENDGRRTYLWTARGKEGGVESRSLIDSASPVETRKRIARRKGAARIDDLLFEAILLSVRTLTFGPLAESTERCRLVKDVGIAGERYVVIEERLEPADESLEEHRRDYWLDPKRDFAIVRVVELLDGSPRTQIDLQYNSHAAEGSDPLSALLPKRWVAMTMDKNQDATSYVYADRKGASRGVSDVEERMQVALPPDTWVVDQVRKQSYIAKADGSRVALREHGFVPGVSAAEVLARADSRWWLVSLDSRRLRRAASAALAWPGILVTLGVVGGIGWIGRRVVQRVRRRSPV